MLNIDLDAATIPELRRLLDDGTITSVELTEAYLARIRALDPLLRSVLHVDPSARDQAAARDRERAERGPRGPLDGIPVLVKDNIDTIDMPTTGGSRALLDIPVTADATVITRLRAAGAVLLGKTNLSEWANFRSKDSTSGWSAVGGQTVNPHVLNRNPSGSSSGSAVAVAAALAQVALGTETDGSIVSPGGACGITGLKPSRGLVSRAGVIPISSHQDGVGPMARHVVDLAIVLSVLQGRDEADPATAECPADQVTDYAAALDPDALRGARIGVWRLSGSAAGLDAVVQSAVDTLIAAGATVVDVELAYQDEIGAAELPAMWAEFRDELPRYLATRPGAPADLAELIEFNKADLAELAVFGQDQFENAVAAPDVTDAEYRRQRATATDIARRSIDEVLAAEGLDAIVAPSNGPAWPIDYANGDHEHVGSSSSAAVAGYPAVTVPGGFVGPLPVGLSFVAPRFADARVLSMAAAFERASKVRRAPAFLPTVPVPSGTE